MREVLSREPVVVGGTAEDFYTGDVYVETDLDLVGWVTPEEEGLLHDLGFTKKGRHWFHSVSKIAVEFPEGTIDGDETRILRTSVGSGTVALIGVDDLYLDRVRQATVPASHLPALAVAVAAYDEIDWPYVERTIQATVERNPPLGEPMRRVHRSIRRQLLIELRKIGL
jgi:hypothetical protein